MENVKWIEAIWNADKADPSGKRGFKRIFLSFSYTAFHREHTAFHREKILQPLGYNCSRGVLSRKNNKCAFFPLCLCG